MKEFSNYLIHICSSRALTRYVVGGGGGRQTLLSGNLESIWKYKLKGPVRKVTKCKET